MPEGHDGGRKVSETQQDTMSFWSGGEDYTALIDRILDCLPGDRSRPIEVLVPGAGGGRVVADFLSRCIRDDRPCNLTAVEPNQRRLKSFVDSLTDRLAFQQTEHTALDLHYQGGPCRVTIVEGTIEGFFLRPSRSDHRFDLVLALLFFNYVPHAYVSIFRELYRRLAPSGVFVFDEIRGYDVGRRDRAGLPADWHDRAVRTLDAEPELLLTASPAPLPTDPPDVRDAKSLAASYREQHISRLYQDRAYWAGSAVKGTCAEILVGTAKKLFATAYAPILSEVPDPKLPDPKRHLPLWWFDQLPGDPPARTPVVADPPRAGAGIRIAFRAFVFHRKRAGRSHRDGRSFRATVWKTLLKEAAARTVRNFAAVLPPIGDGGMRYTDAREFVQDIIPPVVLQLLLSAGRLRWDSRLTSIYLAAGGKNRAIGLPSLDNLFIAVKGGVESRRDEYKGALQAYLLNAQYYLRVLGVSISDRFNELGQKLVLSRDPESVDHATLERRGYVLVPLPGPTGDPLPLQFDTSLTEVRQILWGVVIAENLVKGKARLSAEEADRLREAVAARAAAAPLDEAALEAALRKIDPALALLHPDIVRPSRNTLLATLTNLVFVPLPSYFGRVGKGSHVAGSILGIGFTLTEVRREDLEEIDRLVVLAGILLRRLQDDFLSLRWVDQAYRSALRSAIATIMGRVNAHDIGHVLANAELPKDNKIKSAYFSHLTDYLRTRMVFAAEAASTDPGWSLSLPFYSMIVTPFTSYPIKGQPPRLLPSPVCQHLAAAEDVTDVQIHVQCDGIDLSYSLAGESFRCEPSDLEVAIPAGVIGVHALYCIFENIIRNGAKYGHHRNPVLRLSVKIDTAGFDEEDQYYRFQVWDDHSVVPPTANESDEAKRIRDRYKGMMQLFPPGIADMCDPGPDTTRKGDEWRIVDDHGQITGGGFGLKEMRICAAWLRGRPLGDTLAVEESLRPPLLQPMKFPPPGTDPGKAASVTRYFGYQFYLLKPKECIFLGTTPQATNTDLGRTGIEFAPRTASAAIRARRHAMAVLDRTADAGSDWMNKRLLLPTRLLATTAPPLGSARSDRFLGELDPVEHSAWLKRFAEPDVSPREVLLEIYAAWLRRTLFAAECDTNGSTPFHLVLHLNNDTTKAAPPDVIEDWTEIAEHFAELGGGRWRLVPFGGPGIYDAGGVPPDRMAVFDDHDVYSQSHPATLSGLRFCETVGGNVGVVPLLFGPPTAKQVRVRLALGLLEAVLMRVAILDERLHQRVYGHAVQPASTEDFVARYSRAGIEVPWFGDWEEGAASQQPPKIIDHFRRLAEGNKTVHVLSIHQGILDKLFTSRGEAENWVRELSKHVWSVVVHSDRGESLLPKRPRNARFIPYSSIAPWLVARKTSKYHLTQVLLSAGSGVESDDAGVASVDGQ